MNNTVNVNCTTDRNNHVNYHGSVKECNVKVLSYYNIAITTKSTMALNIVRRYQNNMIENQKSTDHDDNSDRKRHGQTNHGFNSAGVGRRTQPISKLLNALLITSALNPTCLFIIFITSVLNPFSELLPKYYSPIKKLKNFLSLKL